MPFDPENLISKKEILSIKHSIIEMFSLYKGMISAFFEDVSSTLTDLNLGSVKRSTKIKEKSKTNVKRK